MLTEILNSILKGNLSNRATGFLVALPSGVTGKQTIKDFLIEAYGNESHPDLLIMNEGNVKIDDSEVIINRIKVAVEHVI